MESDDFGERCCMVLAVHLTFTRKREKISRTVVGPGFDHSNIFMVEPINIAVNNLHDCHIRCDIYLKCLACLADVFLTCQRDLEDACDIEWWE